MDQLSTEPIAGATPPAETPVQPCLTCGAPLASDQRYCLQCGERRRGAAAFPGAQAAAAASPAGPGTASPPAAPPGWRPPGAPGDDQAAARNGGLLLLAGIGLLLLAMGIGVLIGRSGAKQTAAPPSVVTVGSAPSSTAGATSSGEEAFSDDWPSGKKGFTVQLQTLPGTGTSKSAVEQAKSAATAKGAGAVGALLSDHFTSLAAGSYVIYSGIYSKRSEAQKALAGLKGKFPGAKVIQVSAGSAAGGSAKEAAGSGSGSSSGGGGGGEGSLSKPAPPSTLEKVSKAHGKNYEEQSSKLPNVVSTG